jgi:hypothetical protein
MEKHGVPRTKPDKQLTPKQLVAEEKKIEDYQLAEAEREVDMAPPIEAELQLSLQPAKVVNKKWSVHVEKRHWMLGFSSTKSRTKSTLDISIIPMIIFRLTTEITPPNYLSHVKAWDVETGERLVRRENETEKDFIMRCGGEYHGGDAMPSSYVRSMTKKMLGGKPNEKD